MAINSHQFREATKRSFTGMNLSNGKTFDDLVLDSNGILYSVKDAAQADVFGRRICKDLVKPTAEACPPHIKCLNPLSNGAAFKLPLTSAPSLGLSLLAGG